MTLSIIQNRTKRFKVNLVWDGQPYELQSGENIIFTVKRNVLDDEILLQKAGGTVIEIRPEDTVNMPAGVPLVYDFVIRKTNGDLYTVVPVGGARGTIRVERGVYDGRIL